MSDKRKTVIWGDSVARGVVYDAVRGRYAIAKENAAKFVADALGIEVLNRSRMGMTSTDGLRAVGHDLEKGVRGDVAIIEFGGNDCDFNWKEISETPLERHLPRTEAGVFEENMKKMISETKNAGFEVMLVSLPPINAENYFDFVSRDGLSSENILRWLGDKNHIYRFHERYSAIVSKIARETGCKLLDIRSAFLDLWNNADLVCLDGIHPTEKGQRFMGEAIVNAIS